MFLKVLLTNPDYWKENENILPSQEETPLMMNCEF
jgi:hypothetical protein